VGSTVGGFASDHPVAVACGSYLAAAAMLIPHYQHKLYPDTTSYISIALKYLNGDFAHAINGYWAPLLPWLMVPLLRLHLDPLVAMKIVSVGAGLAVIAAAAKLFELLPIESSLRHQLIAATTVIVLYCALSMGTPDVLLMASLTAYFAVILHDSYRARSSRGAVCGLLGGVAYLAKHYALPFFVLHFTLVNLWYCRHRESRRTVLTNLCSGLAVCALLALPWATAMSLKYGMPTTGTVGGRAWAYVGPDSRGIGFHGLVAPPNPTAWSAWEDPSYDPVKSWSPLASRANVLHLFRLVASNARDAAGPLLQFSPILLIVAAGCVVWRVRPPDASTFVLVVLSTALFTGGYVVVHVEERLLWPIWPMLLLITGALLSALSSATSLRLPLRRVVISGAIATCVAWPAAMLVSGYNEDTELVDMARVLKSDFGVGGNIAAHDAYKDALYLAYYMDARFFGTTDRRLPVDEIERSIQQHRIDYYLVFSRVRGSTDRAAAFLSKYPEITRGAVPGVLVYAMKTGRGGD
jgi:hypothetical protein